MLRLSVLSSSAVLAQALFPDCIMKDKVLRGRGEYALFFTNPLFVFEILTRSRRLRRMKRWNRCQIVRFSLFTDVSPFGLSGCFLENCQDSDKWISPSEAVCAESCGRVPGTFYVFYFLRRRSFTSFIFLRFDFYLLYVYDRFDVSVERIRSPRFGRGSTCTFSNSPSFKKI